MYVHLLGILDWHAARRLAVVRGGRMRRSLAAASWLPLLLVACYLGQQALLCEGHGFMLTPLSRGRLSGYAEWEVAGGKFGRSFAQLLTQPRCTQRGRLNDCM